VIEVLAGVGGGFAFYGEFAEVVGRDDVGHWIFDRAASCDAAGRPSCAPEEVDECAFSGGAFGFAVHGLGDIVCVNNVFVSYTPAVSHNARFAPRGEKLIYANSTKLASFVITKSRQDGSITRFRCSFIFVVATKDALAFVRTKTAVFVAFRPPYPSSFRSLPVHACRTANIISLQTDAHEIVRAHDVVEHGACVFFDLLGVLVSCGEMGEREFLDACFACEQPGIFRGDVAIFFGLVGEV